MIISTLISADAFRQIWKNVCNKWKTLEFQQYWLYGISKSQSVKTINARTDRDRKILQDFKVPVAMNENNAEKEGKVQQLTQRDVWIAKIHNEIL